MHSHQGIPDIEELASTRLPLFEAATLPSSCYTNAEFYQLEVNKIFSKEWIYVGRAERLKKPGDYFVVDIVGTPVVVVMNRDSKLRAHAAVCRHRSAQVISGEGNVSAIVCPYHGWGYSLNGELMGAPEMEKTKGFNKCNFSLTSFGVENWEGFLFVNFDPKCTPLAPRIGGLAKRLEAYKLGEMRCAKQMTYDLECNWKVYVENAMEEYHTAFVHRVSLEPIMPMKSWQIEKSDGLYEVMYCPLPVTLSATGVSLLPKIPSVKDPGFPIALIYPNFVIGAVPEGAFTLSILPQGPQRITLIAEILFPETTIAQEKFADICEESYYPGISAFVDEDNAACLLNQRGYQSPLAKRGRYSSRESLVHRINNYVLSCLYDGGSSAFLQRAN